jgi:hypothetical protein
MKAETIRVAFDDPEFMREARQLFEAQLRNPHAEPPLLLFNSEGESIRCIIQRVVLGDNWLPVSVDGWQKM